MIAAAPEPKANMGKPEPRYDGRLKVTGAARYSSDMPLNNPVFALLVTSSIAKGQIEKLDLALARAVPGVLDILTQRDGGDVLDPRGNAPIEESGLTGILPTLVNQAASAAVRRPRLEAGLMA